MRSHRDGWLLRGGGCEEAITSLFLYELSLYSNATATNPIYHSHSSLSLSLNCPQFPLYVMLPA
jgi:hypothetical protein